MRIHHLLERCWHGRHHAGIWPIITHRWHWLTLMPSRLFRPEGALKSNQ